MILNLSNSRGLENNFKAESLVIESILQTRGNRFSVMNKELGMNVENTYQLHHKNKQYVIAASQNNEIL